MGNVMKADGSTDQAFAEKDWHLAFPGVTDIWVQFKMACTAAQLAFWTSAGGFAAFTRLHEQPGPHAEFYYLDDAVAYGDFWFGSNGGGDQGSVPPPVADAWMDIKIHRGDFDSQFYVNGTQVWDVASGLSSSNWGVLDLGIFQANSLDPNAILYFDEVLVGTTEGGDDIFSDDFESGTFAAWDATLNVSIVDDPFTPPPRIVVQADTPIRTLITDMDSRTIAHFDRLETDRAWLYTLNAAAYHTGQVPSDSLEVNRPFPDADSPANLTNNRRLIFSLQRWKGSTPPYQPIFGGIVTIPEDQGTDAPTTRYTAHDPWQLMMSRPIRDPDTGDLPGPNGITFAVGSRASDIALSFLAQTEAFDGETHIDSSDSGLIEATDPLPSEITFSEGTMVGEAWTQLTETGTIDIHLPPMYEPIDAPGKVVRFQTVRQADGVAAGPIRASAVMGWDRAGNSAAEINRMVDGTRMANTVAFYDANGNAVPIQTDAASVLANGVYFAQQFFPGANDTTLIALLAVAQLAIRRKGQRSISLSPTPERTVMPLRDYGLGDYLPVWASSNLREPLGVDYDTFDPDNPGASGYQRVYAIPLAADDNGVTTVVGLLTSKEN